MTYKEFMDRYGPYMVVLEVYNKNGEEVDDSVSIPDETPVVGFSQRSGSFDVVVDI